MPATRASHTSTPVAAAPAARILCLVLHLSVPCRASHCSGTAVEGGEQHATLQALLEGALLCNDSHLNKDTDPQGGGEVYTPNGAPTEVALITAGLKAGLDPAELAKAKPRLASVPFESEHKVGGMCLCVCACSVCVCVMCILGQMQDLSLMQCSRSLGEQWQFALAQETLIVPA